MKIELICYNMSSFSPLKIINTTTKNLYKKKQIKFYKLIKL